MMDECIFCQIVEGKIPCTKIYEDESVLAFLDINPISPGHTLVIPRQHYSRLDQCSSEVVSALVGPLGSLARAIVQAVQAEGYNVLNNNGRCAGQLVEHVHFHIIPRHADDGVFNRWPAGQYQPGRREELARHIINNLSE